MTGLRFANGRPAPNLSMLIDGEIKTIREVPKIVNHSINPSFETTDLRWIRASGGENSAVTETPHRGTQSGRVVFAAAATYKYLGQYVLSPGGYTYVKARLFFRNISGSTHGRMRIGWRDHATTGTVRYSDLVPGVETNGEWTELYIEHAIPANSIYIPVIAYGTDSVDGFNSPANNEFHVDSMCVTLGMSPETTPDPVYFDGDFPSTSDHFFTWDGLPHQSNSVKNP